MAARPPPPPPFLSRRATAMQVTGSPGHISEVSSEGLPRIHQQPSAGWPQGEGQPLPPQTLPLLNEVLALLAAAPPSAGRDAGPSVIVEFKGHE